MRINVRSRVALVGAAALVSSIGLAGCGGGGGGGSSDSNTVTIWSSVDAPVKDGLQKALVAKLKTSNPDIKVNWQSVQDINQLIITKIQAGDTPDIAFVPQPGVVKQMNDLGAIKPLDDVVDKASLEKSMIPGSLDFSTIDSKLYGLIVSMNVKGLVFYNKPEFDKAGYKAPEDLAGLQTLVDQIKNDGTAPWCFGIESDTATGWPATDWIETLLMKLSGPDVYNQWVSHDIPFNDPQVKAAVDEFGKLVLTDGNTFGGQSSIASTNFGTAGNGLWTSPPKCYLQEQGSFITGFYPKNVLKDIDTNVGVFGVPPVKAGGDNPVEVGGDTMTMLNDSDNVKAVVKALSETDIGNDAAETSSFISPHTDFDASHYPNKLTKQMADVAYNASVTLFDASDQMPAAVGSGTFWKEMTAWISGQEDESSALDSIESSWPSS